MKTSPFHIGPRRLLGAFLCLLFLSTAAGCARSPIETAMAGGYEKDRNNKIIVSYCTSCHTHKDFEAPPHLETVAALYAEAPYKGSDECRVCHRVDIKGWAVPWVQRHTYRPHGLMTPMAKQVKPPEPPTLQ